MSIKEDLGIAKDSIKNIIAWHKAIELISDKNQTTRTETARWLILKSVHQYVRTYLVNPSIPMAKEVEAKITENYLQNIVRPSWQNFILNITNPLQHSHEIESVDVDLLNSFLESNNIEPITLEIDISTADEKTQNDVIERMPQRRVRMIFETLSSDEGHADILALPTNAKRKLKHDLLEKHPQIFTNSTFDTAWSDASASGMIGIAEKEKFMPKNKSPRSGDT